MITETNNFLHFPFQVVREIPVAGVLGDLEDETKFEGSGIAQRGHGTGQYFVVFDK